MTHERLSDFDDIKSGRSSERKIDANHTQTLKFEAMESPPCVLE